MKKIKLYMLLVLVYTIVLLLLFFSFACARDVPSRMDEPAPSADVRLAATSTFTTVR